MAYRHGLDGPELADALGVSPTNANKMVYRLRETIELSLGALLVSRRACNTPDGCPELTTILDGWDGRFGVLMRKRIARHIEACPTCDEERQRLVSPVALLGGVPVFIPAPAWLRDRTISEIQLTSSPTPIADDTVDPGAENESGSAESGQAENVGAAVSGASPPYSDHVDVRDHRTRRWVLVIALFAATLITSLGLTIAWLYQQNTTIVPTDVSDTAPKTVGTAPAAPTPSSPPTAPPPAGVATTVPAATVPPALLTPPVQPTVPLAPPPSVPTPASEPTPPVPVPVPVPRVPPQSPSSSVPTLSLPRVPPPSQPAPTRTAITPPPTTRNAITPPPSALVPTTTTAPRNR